MNNPLGMMAKASTERGDRAIQKESSGAEKRPRTSPKRQLRRENSSNPGVLQALINGCSESPANPDADQEIVNIAKTRRAAQVEVLPE
jgi:hypothetical protein